MPAGSYMARIYRQGRLIAGVNAGFYRFGYLNPFDGQIEGFEIDLVHDLAKAIFGNPNAVRLVALTAGQRIDAVRSGRVNIVVDAMTIDCYRRTRVTFSNVYYNAHQRVLVLKTSTAGGLQDLGGQKVCATYPSVPYDIIKGYPSHPIAVGRPQGVDCLVALQQGKVAAISTDDAILLGFKAQDPNTKIAVGPSPAAAPYGMAINSKHRDFVRFVNGVLLRIFQSGEWQRIYKARVGGPVPVPPKPTYDG
jgi:polar amino acid transport system substrate-binding protein